jgi:hypothetical protein
MFFATDDVTVLKPVTAVARSDEFVTEKITAL